MNSVNLVGRFTKEPESRKTNNGSTSLPFCIAVDRNNKNHDTDFIDCQAWNKQAEFITQYFHKGDPIMITGELQTRTYEKDGRKVKVTEVNVLSVGFCPRSNMKLQEGSESINSDDECEF